MSPGITSSEPAADEVIAAINVKNLVDVRSPDEFSGKILAPAHLPQEQSQRPGHIPGAINVPFDFLPDHAEAWKKEKRQLVTYCACVNEGTAVRAAEDMTAFGVPNVKAMLGGWNEWVKRKEKIEVSK